MRGAASAIAIVALLVRPISALAQGETVALPEITVIAPSPLGGYVDRDKVPGTVQTLTAPDFTRTESPNATETLFRRIPGVSISDPSGNTAAQALEYRGFAASPVQGTPQGIAVYMSGIRFNEAFGDTVNWDLIPTIAIDTADLWTNNPVFGLNALGGAINLKMKNGFTYRGTEAEVQGGSFGTFTGAVQTGVQFGDDAVYLAAQGSHQGGWRFQSAADLARVYADFGRRIDRGEFHLVAAGSSVLAGGGRGDPDPTARSSRRPLRLHDAANDEEPDGPARVERQLRADRHLVAAGQPLRPGVQPKARRRQHRRIRALQYQRQPPIPRPSVPGGRRLSRVQTR